jgi:uncharacterized protein YggE
VALGKVTSINETVQNPYQPQLFLAAAASPAAARVPIQAGSQNVSVTVTVSYAIA